MKFYIELLTLAALWGASFLFMKISGLEFGPIALIFIRTGLAALVLLPFVVWTKSTLKIFTHWKIFLFIGAISTAIPFSLFVYSSLYLTAGNTSILNATTPFFSAIVALIFLHERLSIYGVSGLVLGFSGVYLLSLNNAEGAPDGGGGVLPIAAVLVATLCYAVSTTFVKLKMSQLKPLVVATGSQLFSALILLPFAVYTWPQKPPSPLSWGGAVALAVFSTAVALIIFFRLIQTVGVTKTVSVTYLIPIFGILWGYIFLDETLELSMILGGSLVLLGVGLTTGLFKRKTALVPAKSAHIREVSNERKNA